MANFVASYLKYALELAGVQQTFASTEVMSTQSWLGHTAALTKGAYSRNYLM